MLKYRKYITFDLIIAASAFYAQRLLANHASKITQASYHEIKHARYTCHKAERIHIKNVIENLNYVNKNVLIIIIA